MVSEHINFEKRICKTYFYNGKTNLAAQARVTLRDVNGTDNSCSGSVFTSALARIRRMSDMDTDTDFGQLDIHQIWYR